MEDKKISVIIPFKNRINLLIEAIESVQLQTYRNIEIIVVDDNSTDNLDLLFQLIAHDDRIRYILSDRHGASAARNIGINHSSGEYIAFLDSDDLFLPGKLKTQLNYMLNTGYAISHTSYKRITYEGSPLDLVNTHYFQGKIFPQILACCPIATPTVMAERALFHNNCFNENYTIGEDVCLWIDVSYKNEFGTIEEALTKVRISQSSAFQDKYKLYIGLSNIIKHILNHTEYMMFRSEVCTVLRNLLNILDNLETIQQSKCSQVKHIKSIIKKLLPPIILDIKKYLGKNVNGQMSQLIIWLCVWWGGVLLAFTIIKERYLLESLESVIGDRTNQ